MSNGSLIRRVNIPMTRNGAVLTFVAVVLTIVYVIFFTDLFTKKSIVIIPQIRPGRESAIPRPSDSPPVYPVVFKLNGNYRLTSVKVVNAKEFATNKYATPLWHMISDSNSIPQDWFMYGLRIPGMKPAIPRSRPQALEPDVSYLLTVEAGKLKGQTNFITREAVPLGARR
jgi:hypothetical protein